MMNTSLVSVIVPVYNIENYVSSCIESILSQTYRNIEVILVNDGSTDNSELICNEYASIDSRIRVISKPNGGLSSARNSGLNIAKGAYILFVDGDDYINPYLIEKTLIVAVSYKVDLVQFSYKEQVRGYKIVNNTRIKDIHVYSERKIFFEKLYEIGGEAASSCTKLYHHKLFKNLRFKDGIIHEDEYLISRLLAIANRIAYCDAQLYYYIKREDSIINNSFSIKKLDLLYVIEDRIQILKSLNYNSLIEKEYARYFINLIRLYSEAKCERFYEASKTIKIKFQQNFSSIRSIKCINFKFKIAFKLMKYHLIFLDLYSVYRKVKKRIFK